jgi:hypothetical protein
MGPVCKGIPQKECEKNRGHCEDSVHNPRFRFPPGLLQSTISSCSNYIHLTTQKKARRRCTPGQSGIDARKPWIIVKKPPEDGYLRGSIRVIAQLFAGLCLLSSGLYRRPWNFTRSCAICARGLYRRSGVGVFSSPCPEGL